LYINGKGRTKKRKAFIHHKCIGKRKRRKRIDVAPTLIFAIDGTNERIVTTQKVGGKGEELCDLMAAGVVMLSSWKKGKEELKIDFRTSRDSDKNWDKKK